jgi:hypothetical protein
MIKSHKLVKFVILAVNKNITGLCTCSLALPGCRFQQHTKKFFMVERHWLLHQWDACLNINKDIFTAFTPSPQTISKWVSFEQPSHVIQSIISLLTLTFS